MTEILNNGTHISKRQTDEKLTTVASSEDLKASPAPKKLGFGIMGSGRRATGLSVFHQEEEEEKTEDRKLRPLVPIDYSAEEMEAVATPNPPRASSPQAASNLAAAAEFARSLSGFGGSNAPKDDRKEDGDRDRSRRKRDRHEERDHSRKEKNRDRDRERGREERHRSRDREEDRERKDLDKEREKEQAAAEKIKALEPKKILNAKQLIDTIPKTKEELFAYPVDWDIYDKVRLFVEIYGLVQILYMLHDTPYQYDRSYVLLLASCILQHELHERMRPWISKKITEFLGEEETTLVDFIVSNTCKHVTAASMLELLESILDDEAELFVLKMWRMLIFEVRRIETGLANS
jgi:RNA-binding protein 25